MRVGLCQINPTVGDFAGNRDRIVAAVRRAHGLGAELCVFPESCVTGYPAMDLLQLAAFRAASDRTVLEIAEAVPQDQAVLVGAPAANPAPAGRPIFNAAWLLQHGTARVVARKCLLPTYDVFDESRHFEPAGDPESGVHTLFGTRVGISICEDIWNDLTWWERPLYALDPIQRQLDAGAELLVNLSASPWAHGKHVELLGMLGHLARRSGRRIVLCNQTGGNVGLLFFGGSVAVGPEGCAGDPVLFAEDVRVVDTAASWRVDPVPLSDVRATRAALVMGLRDYFQKFDLGGAVVGLSGGIDSAVVAALAVEALGQDQVVGIGMPSAVSSEHSVADARALADNLGIRFHLVPIGAVQAAWQGALAEVFAGRPEDLTEENLQSRIRGSMVMAFSNKFGHLMLATGNKSECAVGYATLYGDTCGALAPLADLYKDEVYRLARCINAERDVIPASTLDKPPSAELRPGQLDTDSLPPYPVLDAILRHLVDEERSVAETSERTGHDEPLVRRVWSLLQRSEFKRYQLPPVLRVSGKAWLGRDFPVMHQFRE
jgi:NAD+ synthase (glutamine-hydrolysing)